MTRYDAATALVVVDVQNDFADPHGGLAVRGGEQVAAAATREAAEARAAGALVVCTQDWHPTDTPHFAKDGGTWPVHCVGGTWGAELHPGLDAPGERVRKGTGGEDGYSGFTVRDPVTGAESPTPLEALLRERGVERLVVCGIATDYCVLETVLDAVRLGFPTTVLTAAVRPVDLEPGDGDRALSRMAQAGAQLA
ncbi:MAG TPA: isochorismatase family protein [Mycobacteriales bacterium]|nr:isochorismatase family protein [Mycobacteriales bacterium]